MFDLILADLVRCHNDSLLWSLSLKQINTKFKLSPVLRVGEEVSIRVPGDNTKMYIIIRRA